MLVLKEMALSSTSTFGKRAKLKETAACSRSDIWTLSGAGAAGASGPGAPPGSLVGRTCFTPGLHTSRKRDTGTQLEELSREKLRRGEARGRIGKDLNEWSYLPDDFFLTYSSSPV
ncbi:uncharacterized protein LOC125083920 isoform X2 [Lutra lutra]|uniref:uncharacterized protein LOC125083920 isoform X2 n=1 Tax=Lutra lutra TaxID=9657 RepID=UPI001FD43B3C|nr:uncharacterized protein LOC125083920 isoform X2 [Lutra lutra]